MMLAAALTVQNQMTDDAPWIVWTKSEPVHHLKEEKQTDGRFAEEAEHIRQDEGIHPAAVSVQVQTNRYHSVLARMDQAYKKASAFSSWGN